MRRNVDHVRMPPPPASNSASSPMRFSEVILVWKRACPDIASRKSNVLSINHHKRFIVAESPEGWALHDRDELESRTYSGDQHGRGALFG